MVRHHQHMLWDHWYTGHEIDSYTCGCALVHPYRYDLAFFHLCSVIESLSSEREFLKYTFPEYFQILY